MNAAFAAIITFVQYFAFDAIGALADPALGLIARVWMLFTGVLALAS